MKEYKLTISIEAKSAKEAADILYDELYFSGTNINIEARDMKEVSK